MMMIAARRLLKVIGRNKTSKGRIKRKRTDNIKPTYSRSRKKNKN